MNPSASRIGILWLLLVAGVAPRADAEPVYRGKVFLGVGGATVQLPEDDRYASKYGIKLSRLPVGSTAERAGLNPGDIVVSIDGAEWIDEQIRLSRSFGKAGDKAVPGKNVNLLVLRMPADGDSAPRLESIDLPLAAYPRTAEEQPRTPTNGQIRPDLVDHGPAYEVLCESLIDRYVLRDDCRDLLQRIERTQQFPDPDRLAIVRFVHRDPFKQEVVGRELIDAIAGKEVRGASDGSFWIEHASSVLFFGETLPPSSLESPTFAGGDLDAHLDYMVAVLKVAADLNALAFADLDEAAIQTILDHRAGLFDAFIDLKMLSYDGDRDRQVGYVKLLDHASRVRIEPLLQQAAVVQRLVNPTFTRSLRRAAEVSGVDLSAGVVRERETPHGKIRIAGVGRQRHTDDCAVLFDLGGDDVYANNQGASVPGTLPSAVVVDYEGNDAYETLRPHAQGSGQLGVGILVDLDGDDSYIGQRFVQGTGFLGVGMLIDERGDDLYRCSEMSQGVGHWGFGVLADGAGSDRYEAHVAGQGVGLPGGYGLVYDGGTEGDHYYCKGSQASGYGTAGVFEGWGQGVGFGYRPYASGGVGLLYDAGGADRTEGGNFSQGGGYYYGVGILYNGGDSADRYIGSRWAQGWSAHQATGIMIEAGGDDHYTTRYAVVQGCAWDEGNALFIDEQGDDVYEGGGFSQGAASMNGWSIFLELGGRDTYRYTDQAVAGSNSYHGGTSLSFFVDAGGDEDSYPKRSNNRIESGGAHSIFVDLPGTIAEALKGKVIDSLMGEEEDLPSSD